MMTIGNTLFLQEFPGITSLLMEAGAEHAQICAFSAPLLDLNRFD